jgi:hypothetical protein
MPRGYFEETRAIARLPNLDIEIVHGREADGGAEHISINLRAVPSFEAFGRVLEAANPFLFWMRFAQSAWAPWLGASPTILPPGNVSRLPAPPQSTGPHSTPHREGAP